MDIELRDIPERDRTYPVCLMAVRDNAEELRYVPEQNKTRDLCLCAVEANGYLLQYVPESMRGGSMRGIDLCLSAVHQDGFALQFVPESIDIEKFVLRAQYRFNGLLHCVPAEYFQDTYKATFIRKVIEACLTMDGRELQFVPRESKTLELCLLAMRQNEDAIQFVPAELVVRHCGELLERLNKDGSRRHGI